MGKYTVYLQKLSHSVIFLVSLAGCLLSIYGLFSAPTTVFSTVTGLISIASAVVFGYSAWYSAKNALAAP